MKRRLFFFAIVMYSTSNVSMQSRSIPGSSQEHRDSAPIASASRIGSTATPECPICLKPIDGIQVTLKCKHIFCEDCINRWRAHNGATCPLCRSEIARPTGWELSSVVGYVAPTTPNAPYPPDDLKPAPPTGSSTETDTAVPSYLPIATLAAMHSASYVTPSAPPLPSREENQIAPTVSWELMPPRLTPPFPTSSENSARLPPVASHTAEEIHPRPHHSRFTDSDENEGWVFMCLPCLPCVICTAFCAKGFENCCYGYSPCCCCCKPEERLACCCCCCVKHEWDED